MQLAAAQRMNTDSRRAVFCVLMAADDYVRIPLLCLARKRELHEGGLASC